MIRKSTIKISYANCGKLSLLTEVFDEAIVVVNKFIAQIWSTRDFNSKFVAFKVDTWLSARLQQCLGKQALEIVKSQRKKLKRTMPVFSKRTINLDSRFIDVQPGEGLFDLWIRLTSLGRKLSLKLPGRKHKHFNELTTTGWVLKQSARLRKVDDEYYIDFYFDKHEPEKKLTGKSLGVDIGYKKLLVDSSGIVYDEGLETVYEKISRKRQGSRAFSRSLTERDNLINRTVNRINLSDVNVLIAEDLKNVKKDTRKKHRITKKFSNKLQRWSYPKVLDKLSRVCEIMGITFIKVNPAYTSQTCSLCGHVDKESRSSEHFKCTRCNNTMDADYNAAINVLHRGVYSPPALA
jgi:IS605 OrfB family transposase